MGFVAVAVVDIVVAVDKFVVVGIVVDDDIAVDIVFVVVIAVAVGVVVAVDLMMAVILAQIVLVPVGSQFLRLNFRHRSLRLDRLQALCQRFHQSFRRCLRSKLLQGCRQVAFETLNHLESVDLVAVAVVVVVAVVVAVVAVAVVVVLVENLVLILLAGCQALLGGCFRYSFLQMHFRHLMHRRLRQGLPGDLPRHFRRNLHPVFVPEYWQL